MNCNDNYSYYGDLTPIKSSIKKKKRNLIHYILKEHDTMLREQLVEMEERLKAHAMECKREIMKEVRKYQQCSCKESKEFLAITTTLGDSV